MNADLSRALRVALAFGAGWAFISFIARGRDGEIADPAVFALSLAMVFVINRLSDSVTPLNPRALEFLCTTPWRPGLRTPFHRFAPDACELSFLVFIVAFTSIEGWIAGVIVFGCYVLLLVSSVIIGCWRTGAWGIVSLFLTLVGVLSLVCIDLPRCFVSLLVMLGVCSWAQRRILAYRWKACFDHHPTSDSFIDVGPGIINLAPCTYNEPISLAWRVALASASVILLAGLSFFFARVSDQNDPGVRGWLLMLGTITTITVGVYRVINRVGLVHDRTSLWTRIVHCRPIDRRYDMVSAPLAAGVGIIVCGAIIDPSTDSVFVPMLIVWAAFVAACSINPSREAWRLTAPGVVPLTIKTRADSTRSKSHTRPPQR